jgi:hypothetical protein
LQQWRVSKLVLQKIKGCLLFFSPNGTQRPSVDLVLKSTVEIASWKE